MSESTRDEREPGIPEDPPGPPAGGEAAIPDEPLGVPAEEPDEDELPGLPDAEPPTSG